MFSIKFGTTISAEVVDDNKVLHLGADNIDPQMEEILSKQPGYAVYRKINKKTIEIDYEEATTKMSWGLTNKTEEITLKKHKWRKITLQKQIIIKKNNRKGK